MRLRAAGLRVKLGRMKRAFAVILGLGLFGLCVAPAGAKEPGFDAGSCSFKGKALYGRVKVVSSFPDVRVKKVQSFPDLRVKQVDSFPDSCGKWKMVDSFPDFTVQFVDSFPDVKITYVESFPGT